MEPLPFYALVRTRGPGTWVEADKPLAVGVVTGRSEGPGGWVYSVHIGEISYSFDHDQLIPLGCVLDRVAIYGSDEELESAHDVCRPY